MQTTHIPLSSSPFSVDTATMFYAVPVTTRGHFLSMLPGGTSISCLDIRTRRMVVGSVPCRPRTTYYNGRWGTRLSTTTVDQDLSEVSTQLPSFTCMYCSAAPQCTSAFRPHLIVKAANPTVSIRLGLGLLCVALVGMLLCCDNMAYLLEAFEST